MSTPGLSIQKFYNTTLPYSGRGATFFHSSSMFPCPGYTLAVLLTPNLLKLAWSSGLFNTTYHSNSSEPTGTAIKEQATGKTATALNSSDTSPAVTQRPLYAYDLPSGTPENATTIYCALGDSQCASTCSSIWQVCSSSWASWSSNDVSFTEVTMPTTFPSISYSTSHLESTTTEARQQYVYELGSGIATFTTTVYGWEKHAYDSSVITTRSPPPTCQYQPCSIAPSSTAASCRQSCEVQGGTVELIYWADMALSTSLVPAQASASASIMPGYQNRSSSGARIVTALYKDMTLTSPTVYIDFQTAYATDDCGNTVGKAYPGAVIGVDPQSLYSMQGDWDYAALPTDDGARTTTFYPSARFDFRNLNGQPPVSAYIEQPSCIAQGCYTIWSSLYRPVLVLPSQIRNLDPAWKSCGLDWRGAWDPPVALQPAQVIDPVTTADAPSYTIPASPHSTMSAPASQTWTKSLADPATSTSQGASTLPGTAMMGPVESQNPSWSSESNTARSSSADQALPSISSSSAQAVLETPTSFSYQPLQTADDPSQGVTTVSLASSIDSALSPSSSVHRTSSATNAYEVLTAAQGTTASSTIEVTSNFANLGTSADPEVSSQGRASALLSTDAPAIETTIAPTLSAVPIVGSDVSSAQLFSFASTTLSGGGPALSTAGRTYSVVSGGIMQDGSTISLVTVTSGLISTPQAVITIGTSTAVVHSASDGNVVFGTQTLLSGSGMVLGSHTLSAASDGIVQDGTMVTFSIPSFTVSAQASEVFLTVGSTTAAASQIPGSYIAWAIGSQTLSAGGSAVIMSGHIVSVASSGALLEDGTTAPSLSDSSLSSIRTPTSLSGFLPVITTASSAVPSGQGSDASSPAMSSARVSSSGSQTARRSHRILLFVPMVVTAYHIVVLVA